MKNDEEYKLCYIDGNKAWFTNNFNKQWGDDWNDAPYEDNAGEPYDYWMELIENNEGKYKHYEIKHKCIYFETNDWTERKASDLGNFSVEDINEQRVCWLCTDKFDIFAGITYENFKKIIKENNGKIYIMEELRMNKLEKIDLIFENCDCVTLIPDMFKYLSIEGIMTDILVNCYQYENGELEKIKSCNYFSITINEQGLKTKVSYEDTSLRNRLLAGNDITSICLYFDNKKKMEIYVPWNEKNEWINSYQKNKVEDSYCEIIISKED